MILTSIPHFAFRPEVLAASKSDNVFEFRKGILKPSRAKKQMNLNCATLTPPWQPSWTLGPQRKAIYGAASVDAHDPINH